MADWDEMALVGRVSRPHGIRGEVVVQPETDFVEERFARGARVWARTSRGVEELRVTSARVRDGRAIVGFAGVSTAEEAAGLVGAELRVPEESLKPLEPGTYYQHQLVGCEVVTVDGTSVGQVVRVEGGGTASMLVVAGGQGEVLVPLALDICVDIDVAARRIRIAPPEGLLELNEPAARRGRRARRWGRQPAAGGRPVG